MSNLRTLLLLRLLLGPAIPWGAGLAQVAGHYRRVPAGLVRQKSRHGLHGGLDCVKEEWRTQPASSWGGSDWGCGVGSSDDSSLHHYGNNEVWSGSGLSGPGQGQEKAWTNEANQHGPGHAD